MPHPDVPFPTHQGQAFVPLGPSVIATVPSSPCAPSLLPSPDHCPSSPLCQYEQAADAELAWVAETKRKLMALGPIRLEQDQTTAQLQVQKVGVYSLRGWRGGQQGGMVQFGSWDALLGSSFTLGCAVLSPEQ